MYQIGRKFFCCDGRVVLGDSNKRLVVSLCVFVVLPAVFVGLEAGNGGRQRVNLVEDNEVGLPVVIGLWIASVVTFARCAFADPGILKKQVLLEVDLQGRENGTLLCDKCNVERPNERTLHCRVCDVCVEEMGIILLSFCK